MPWPCVHKLDILGRLAVPEFWNLAPGQTYCNILSEPPAPDELTFYLILGVNVDVEAEAGFP